MISSIHQRGKATVDRGDAAQVVVVDVSKDDGLHILSRQLSSIHEVELFFPRGSKEALHAGVVVASTSTAHALDELVALERLTELPAGKLATPVGVEDVALDLTPQQAFSSAWTHGSAFIIALSMWKLWMLPSKQSNTAAR